MLKQILKDLIFCRFIIKTLLYLYRYYIIPSFSDIWTDFLTRKLKAQSLSYEKQPSCQIRKTLLWSKFHLCPGRGWLSCLLLYSTLALTNRVVYDSARSIRKWPGFNFNRWKEKDLCWSEFVCITITRVFLVTSERWIMRINLF